MKYVYRIVNALMGLGVLAAGFFAGFIKITIGTSTNLDEFFKSITDNKSTGIAVSEVFSVKRIIDFVRGKDELSMLLEDKKSEIFLWPKEFHSLNTRLIVFFVCVAIIVMLAIAVIAVSAASNKRLPMLVLGIAGAIVSIVMIRVFNSMALSILSGDVNMVDYVVDRIVGEGVLKSLIGSAASAGIVVFFRLAGAHIWFLVLFIGVAAWTGIYYLVDIGDPEAKAARLAEKKAEEEKKAAKKAARAAKKAGKQKA